MISNVAKALSGIPKISPAITTGQYEGLTAEQGMFLRGIILLRFQHKAQWRFKSQQLHQE
jgi:hypothetical protein